MKLPELNKEMLVKLDTGKFAVAAFDGEEWFTGSAVCPSHENGSYSISGKVIEWNKLPDILENNLESITEKK